MMASMTLSIWRVTLARSRSDVVLSFLSVPNQPIELFLISVGELRDKTWMQQLIPETGENAGFQCLPLDGHAVGESSADLLGSNGVAVIPTAALDLPYRAAFPAVPALFGFGHHLSWSAWLPFFWRHRGRHLCNDLELSQKFRPVLHQVPDDPRVPE